MFVSLASLPHPLNLTTLTSKKRCVVPSPHWGECHGRMTLQEAAAAPGRCGATWEERSVHSSISLHCKGWVAWCLDKQPSHIWERTHLKVTSELGVSHESKMPYQLGAYHTGNLISPWIAITNHPPKCISQGSPCKSFFQGQCVCPLLCPVAYLNWRCK